MVRTHALMESVSATLHEFPHAIHPDSTGSQKKFLRNRPGDIEQKIEAALSDLWLPMVGEDTPIILDLFDLAKRLAKKMDSLVTVRAGSTGELVRGWMARTSPGMVSSPRRAR